MARSSKDKAISTFGGRCEEIASSLTAAGEATVSPRLAPSARSRFGVARRCCVRSTKWSLKWRKLVHIVSDSARSFRLFVDQTEEEFWR
ncbi:hypothetical protein AOLI_G00311500 [Acnodon oligacanthus]